MVNVGVMRDFIEEVVWDHDPRKEALLLHNYPIRATPSEYLRRVHLFSRGWGYDKRSWCGRSSDIGVVVHTIPEEWGKRLRSFVAHILVFVPRPPPPPAIAVI